MILSDLKNNRVLRIRRWDSSAIRIAKSQPTRAGFYQERISMSVIAAIEFDDLISLGESARQTDGGHRRLGPRVAHPNLLNAGHERANQLRHRDFERIGNSKARTVLGRVLDGFYDFWMRMAEYRWPPRADIVDILVSIHVTNTRPLGLVDEKRLPSNRPKRAHRRIHSARNVFQRLGKKLFRFRSRNHFMNPAFLNAANPATVSFSNS